MKSHSTSSHRPNLGRQRSVAPHCWWRAVCRICPRVRYYVFGLYLAIMLVLFGLIVRAVSLEYRAHDPKWGKVWDALFFIGSLLPALLFGVAIGNVYAGIPLDANGDYAGVPLLGLITLHASVRASRPFGVHHPRNNLDCAQG